MLMQALPIFLDRLADPVTAVLLSITVVLIFGEMLGCSSSLVFLSLKGLHTADTLSFATSFQGQESSY
jgi:hypothetical protein